MQNLRQQIPSQAPAQMSSPRSWLACLALAIVGGGGYFLAARLSLALLTGPDGISVFWPAAGIASGTLIAFGDRVRLPVALGVAVASASAGLLSQDPATAIVFALSNTGEALLVAQLIKYHFGEGFRLESLRGVLGFFAAAGVGAAISGAVATVGFIYFHGSHTPALAIWLNWLASDALGIIMVAPLLIGLRSLRFNPPERWELVKGTLTLAGLTRGVRGRFWLPGALLVHRASAGIALASVVGCPLPPGVRRCGRTCSGFFGSLDGHVWHGRRG